MASRIIARLPDWWPFSRWRVVGVYQDLDDIPDGLPRKGVAIVQAPNLVKWIVFDCPCGTGHRIMLNGDRARRPYWTLHPARLLSVWPSIDFRGSNRRCHYFIRGGRTLWAKDSDR